ncbi:MAG: cation:proton antiporter [Acidobacteria bacterium]|nr:cation:proton antiporter [Acidobacteriota bacterium]
MATGMFVQLVARHLRVPGIVLLLAAGVVLGPDGFGIVRPGALGEALQTLVGFAVAIILFEGAMSLNLRRLRQQARSIRQLVTFGAAVTAVGGALAAHWILGWQWKQAILFGTLVIVTGPTVVTPLLRRMRLQRKLATVLEAEGVFGDAIGAIIAVIALEVVLSPSSEGLLHAGEALLSRFGLGVALGLVVGLVLAVLLRVGGLVPDGLQNVFVLSVVLALFQISNAVVAESGIVSAIVAGVVVGNSRTEALGELREFKEQLTTLFIGMLFVLLAADVRVEEVLSLGWPGLMTVAALMFVVRPLNVAVGTWRTGHTRNEKLFLAWLAPRGIVAAAIASLFAQELAAAGVEGGLELRALVFLVIATTVTVQGLLGAPVASFLGLRVAAASGYVILGASSLGRVLARELAAAGKDVLLIDSNPQACNAAESEGLRVLYGSALQDSVLQRARLDHREGCIAVTTNEGVNFAFARRARREYRVAKVWVAVQRGDTGVSPEMVHRMGGRVLFGAPRRLERWSQRLERGEADLRPWRPELQKGKSTASQAELVEVSDRLLPLLLLRGKKTFPFDETVALVDGDEIVGLVCDTREA